MSLADFCPSSVPKDATKELIQLYSCKDSNNCFLQVNKENYRRNQYNDSQNKKLADARDTWKKNREAYEAKLDSWNKRIGDYSKFSKYDGKSHDFWAVDQDGTCWAGENWNEAHKWCHWMGDKKGYDGENYWAKEWGWCHGRYGNFKCKKDDNTVKSQEAEYQAAKPVFTQKEPTQADFPLDKLLPIENINIQCCSNYMGNADSFVGNEQTCIQTIEQNIIDITGAPPIPTPDIIIPTTPVNSPSEEKEDIKQEEEKTSSVSSGISWTTIGIIFMVVLILCIVFSAILILI